MSIVGHTKAREALEADLPFSSVLLGPSSVGKRSLAEHLTRFHHVQAVDVSRPAKLDIDGARAVRNSFTHRPMGSMAVALLDLDTVVGDAMNVLLKVMEEPPDHVRFICWATTIPLLTVMSRSVVFRLGYLSDLEVKAVLMGMGVEPELAGKHARMSGGQVGPALNAVEVDSMKAPVLQILGAVADGDEDRFRMAIRALDRRGSDGEDGGGYDPDGLMALMRVWSREAVTGRWRVFDASQGYGLQNEPSVARRIERALRTNARPSVLVKVALLPILEERRGRA